MTVDFVCDMCFRRGGESCGIRPSQYTELNYQHLCTHCSDTIFKIQQQVESNVRSSYEPHVGFQLTIFNLPKYELQNYRSSFVQAFGPQAEQMLIEAVAALERKKPEPTTDGSTIDVNEPAKSDVGNFKSKREFDPRDGPIDYSETPDG